MRGLFVLGDGFEDTEAIATADCLYRGKLQLDFASLSDSLEVKTQCGLTVKANVFLKAINPENYDFIVIPGGRAVFSVLDKSTLLQEVITKFNNQGKLIAAICAGPSQVGKLGLLKGLPFTCFPSVENTVIGGIYEKHKGVVRTQNFITAKAMGYSLDFGLEIIDYLLGKAAKEQVRKAMFGEV